MRNKRKDRNLEIPWQFRYWGWWVLSGILWLLFHAITIDAARSLGRKLPNILGGLLKKRARYVRQNLKLAFPDWSDENIENLVEECMQETGACLLETAYLTLCPIGEVLARSEVIDRHVLDTALATGKNILLLSAHYTCMDSCGIVMANDINVDVIYRHQNSAVADYLMKRNRLKIYGSMIHKDDTTHLLRVLKDKQRQRIVWMAPDQDFGKQRSAFVPFLGVDKVATLKIPSRIASVHDMVPIYIEFRYDKTSAKWQIKYKEIHDYPTYNLVQDAETLNKTIGESVKECPEQYYWVHRRFKTLENGETRPY